MKWSDELFKAENKARVIIGWLLIAVALGLAIYFLLR